MDSIQDRIVKQSEVLELVGLSATALKEAIQRGAFPPPLKLTERRAIGWRASDINRWLQDLQPAGSKGAGKECANNGVAPDPSTTSRLVGA